MRHRRTLVFGVGILVLVVLSLQIFLIMVGLEAWLTFSARVAWGAALTSVVLAVVSLLLYRYLHRSTRYRPDVRQPRDAGHR
jgi:membrane protein implicated in regulation of membrane protease activity